MNPTEETTPTDPTPLFSMGWALETAAETIRDLADDLDSIGFEVPLRASTVAQMLRTRADQLGRVEITARTEQMARLLAQGGGGVDETPERMI